jgi:hypothetical protein
MDGLFLEDITRLSLKLRSPKITFLMSDPIIKLALCFHLPNGSIEEAQTKSNTGPTSPIVAPGCGDGFIH